MPEAIAAIAAFFMRAQPGTTEVMSVVMAAAHWSMAVLVPIAVGVPIAPIVLDFALGDE